MNKDFMIGSGPWDDVIITLPDTPMVRKAWQYAARAHASINQLRRNTNEPYIIHPIQVAAMVMTVPHTEEMICASLLHDVPEDLDLDPSVLQPEFGEVITDYVRWLTKPSRNSKEKYDERARMDREFLAQAPAEVQTIKVCDLLLNCRSIILWEPKYAPKYLNKNRKLVEVMTKADPALVDQANHMFAEFFGEDQNINLVV